MDLLSFIDIKNIVGFLVKQAKFIKIINRF